MSINRNIINRCYLSLTTWFYHPDIDMKSWEILSRGSATLIIPPSLPNVSSSSSSTSSSSSSISSSSTPSWQLLASYHVTHPHEFPQYYSYDQYPWLNILSSHNLRYTLELRSAKSGHILFQIPLPSGNNNHHHHNLKTNHTFPNPDTLSSSSSSSTLIGHPGGRDISCMNLSSHFKELLLNQFQNYNTLITTKDQYTLLPLQLSPTNITETASVLFHGHFLRTVNIPSTGNIRSPSSSTDNIENDTLLLSNSDPFLYLSKKEDQVSYLEPLSIPGRILVRSTQQIFARTNEILEMGMCGGPVTLDTLGKIENNNNTNLCYGIIEGIVPVQEKDTEINPNTTSSSSESTSSSKLQNIKKLLSGCTVFIEADVLQEFCKDVYNEGLQYTNYLKKKKLE